MQVLDTGTPGGVSAVPVAAIVVPIVLVVVIALGIVGAILGYMIVR